MPRVLKAAEVYIDQDKTVQIVVPNPTRTEPEDIGPEEIQVERPEDIIKGAEGEAKIILRRAEIESSSVVARAEEDAARLVEEAQVRIEEEGRRIREESRTEGYKEGMDKAKAEGEAIKTEAQAVLEDALREQDETRKAIEPDAVNLIISILEKLLAGAVKINPDVVVSLIRMGFAGINSLSGQVTIRVSEVDFAKVSAHKDEIVAAAGGTVEIEIVRDLSMGPADCVIDTPFGGIDVSLTPQFEALKENLIYLLEH